MVIAGLSSKTSVICLCFMYEICDTVHNLKYLLNLSIHLSINQPICFPHTSVLMNMYISETPHRLRWTEQGSSCSHENMLPSTAMWSTPPFLLALEFLFFTKSCSKLL